MTDEVWSVMMVTGLEKVFVSAPDTLTALAGLQLSDAGGLWTGRRAGRRLNPARR
jgi:hypothetical protein